MFIIRNVITNETSEVFYQTRKFSWLNGNQGFNAKANLIHGDEKLYEVETKEIGTGIEVTESEPVYDLVNDKFVITRTRSDPVLTDSQKADFKSRINEQAENTRLQYITPGDGQAMSYREKLDEAKACLAIYPTETDFTTANPAAGTYLLLESEIGIHGDNAWQVSNRVNTTYLMWKTIEASINNLRQQAAKNIDSATTFSEAQNIIDNISWPSP